MTSRFAKTRRDKLVEGPVLPAIWTMAYPMIVTMGLQSLFNIVDIYFVGKLGSDAVAAVGMSGIIMFFMMTLMIGLGTATRALIARFIGSNRFDSASEIASSSLIIAFIISVLAGVFGTTLAPQILVALGADKTVLTFGVQYIQIMFIGMMSLAFTASINSILQGAGDAKTPMFILLFSVGLNIFLDPMLILGIGPFPKLGVRGAAIATVSARGIAMIIGMFLILRGINHFKLSLKSLRWNGSRIWQVVKIGFPAAIQPAMNNIAGLIMIRIVSGFSMEAVAAFVVAMRINMFALLPGFGLGNANGTIVGQNLGAGRPARAKRSTWITCGILEIVLITIGAVFYIFAPWIITKFNDNPEVVRIGVVGLRTLTLGYPILAIATILARAINGAGVTKIPAIILAIAFFAVQVPLAVVLSRTTMEVTGVFVAVIIGFFVQAVIFSWYFLSNRWAKAHFS
ncbi:hypothetical protein DRQ36_07510 [bacterium]|nr:MAG: hypothetical protein DRQ36_07510 [bacterium]